MRVRHPYALDDDAPAVDNRVHWGGRREWSDVDDDGTFGVPPDATHHLDEWAERYGHDLSDLIVSNGTGGDSGGGSDDTASGSDSDDADVCTATLTAGGTCGRDLPCPYHTED